MTSEELIKYISEAKGSGLNNTQIRQNLLSAGWPESEINKALNPAPQPSAMAGPPPPSPQSSKAVPQVSSSNLMAVLAYLGILIIVPVLTAKDEPFVKFHIKQGIALIILWVIIWFFSFVFGILTFAIGFPIFFLSSFLWGLSVILVIIGIVNAAGGKMKELPLIGSWGNKFNF